MRLTLESTSPEQIAGDCLVLFYCEEVEPGPVWTIMDGRLGGKLHVLRARGDLCGKSGEVVAILDPTGIVADRLLLVGLGKVDQVDRIRLSEAASAAARALTSKARRRLVFVLPDIVTHLDRQAVLRAVAAGAMHGCSGPGLYKTEPARFEPEEICLASSTEAQQDLGWVCHHAEVEGQAVRQARQWINQPPCALFPASFAEQASQASRRVGVDCIVLDEMQLAAERMDALLAVGRGSDQQPRLVVLHYRRGTHGKTLGLVGKGVTFDSGGLSLKTTEQMVDMKCDMSGAAAVLAAICACAELQIPVNLLGVLPLVENMPGGKALKLGDVIRTRNGKTIEVLNTDAEGRLILADALAFAVDQGADHLVDLATLTGACLIALGTETAGLMGNNDSWCDRVQNAARLSGERVWRLPLDAFYGDMIKSTVADMKNTGGTRYAGAITAAKLLEQFVGQIPWVHLDIAGPAWAEKENAVRDAGGTGCFVRTLIELASHYDSW